MKKKELKKLIKKAIDEDRVENLNRRNKEIQDKTITYLHMGVAFGGLIGVIIVSMGFVYGVESYLTGGMLLTVLSIFGYISLDNAITSKMILKSMRER